MGVIGPCELDAGVRFHFHPRTSGLNRKLSVFVFKRVEISGFEVELVVIGPIKFDAGISYNIRLRTSGLTENYRF